MGSNPIPATNITISPPKKYQSFVRWYNKFTMLYKNNIIKKREWHNKPIGTIVLSILAGLFFKGFFLLIEQVVEIF